MTNFYNQKLIAKGLKMGNRLMQQCNGQNNKIEGFNNDILAIAKSTISNIPERSIKVQQTYRKLITQKAIDYTLENQKNSFQPITLNIFQEDGVYIGWIKNDKPHGPGQLYFNNHNFLQTIFKQGEADCQDAVYIESNGNYYRGAFKKSKQNGLGVLSNGQNIITGHFVNGLAQGKGEKLFVDGRIYSGQFKNGKMEGKGTLIFKTHQKYIGNFKENKRSGIGKFENQHYEYFGPYKNDQKEGKGTIIFKDGTKFEGWFEDDRIQGYGQWHRSNGIMQKGNYTLNLQI